MPYEQGEILKKFMSGPLCYANPNLDADTQPFSPALTVAFFSGRGPKKLSPGILKLDVVALELNILTSVPKAKGNFAFKSSTSPWSHRI